MPGKDYYSILGVEQGASQDEIKRAYRRLARKHHPDANKDDPGAADKFKEISEAYRVLSDPEKRARYDQFGDAAGPGGFDFGGQAGFGDFSSAFDDLFDAFFGGGFRRGRTRGPRPQAGADLRTDLSISFHEAAFGVEKEIEVPREETCPTCGGDGAEPGTSPRTCPDCQGTGEIRTGRPTPFGSFYSVSPCGRCAGTGRIIENLCPECRGRGRVRRSRRISVRIPAGVEDGTSIRLAGQGEPGQHGGPTGDLYVVLRVKPHPGLTRRGSDVVSTVRISYVQAALGTTIEVETLDGTEEVTVPPGTQPGGELVLKNRGIPHLRGYGRGDHRIQVEVSVPARLSARERELLQELAKVRGETVGKGEKGFLGKVKDAFNL